MQIDTIDLRLLSILQTDASLTNQMLAERAHVSPATALRRVQRLTEAGIIEHQVALLSPEKLNPEGGALPGVIAYLEITLERQEAAALDAFEAAILDEACVTQCSRVSGSIDFMLCVHCEHMSAYDAFTQGALTGALGVRNVRSFFVTRRAKFRTELPVAWFRKSRLVN